jgi:4-amino-4-deoxy-L-arabinose transferase-like glycosyltransferase
MTLEVDVSGTHTFELDSSWDGGLDIDGERVFGSGPKISGHGRSGEVELARGVHRARLFVQPSGGADSGIRLLWSGPKHALRPVDKDDLTLPENSGYYTWAARVSMPFLGGGLLLIGLIITHWISKTRVEVTRRDKALAILTLLVISFLARFAHFDTYPRGGGDEYHNAWAGWNLIHEGSPKTWSWLSVYESKEMTEWFSYGYPMVARAFDHPPLAQVLAGGVATVLGAKNMFQCTLSRIRPMMVVVGVGSVILLFVVALEVTSFPTAFLAGLIMAVSPLVVFLSRLVKEDCFVQLFLLFALFTYLKGERRKSLGLDFLTGLFCGLAAFSKVLGVAVGVALAAASIVEDTKNIRRPAVILGGTLAIGALYPLYGILIDSRTFFAVLGHLSLAYPHESIDEKLLILPKLILAPKITGGEPMIDAWIILGWLSVFHLRKRPLAIGLAAYLLILMATVRSNWIWGFYIVPVLPFLCIAAAIQIQSTFLRRDFLSIFFFSALFFLPTFGVFAGTEWGWDFRVILLLACIPLATSVLRSRYAHSSAVTQVVLGVMLILSIFASFEAILTTL